MAKKIYGQTMYIREPHFPSYGGDYLNGSSYAADQSYTVDADKHIHQTRMAIQELEIRYEEVKMNHLHAVQGYESMKRNIALAAQAPTQQDLDDYPGLANAWDQYIIVKKLVKGQ
jgi:hypothetical protein